MKKCYPRAIGAISPVPASDGMTQPVGQRDGQLYTYPQADPISDLDMYLSLAYDRHVTVIPDGTDFNNIDTPGNYRVSSSASMQTMVNSPTTDAARIIVLEKTSATTLTQFVIPNSAENQMFYRTKTSSGWKAWSPLITRVVSTVGASESDVMSQKAVSDAITRVESSLDDYVSLTFNRSDIIPNGTDFNDLVTPGNYRVASSASMQTMTNSPTTDGSKVIVMTRTTATSFAQIVIPYSVDNKIFYRAKRSSGWNAWSELVGDETLGHITAETLAQFFTDANNAPINSTYSIGDNVPMNNLPPGNNMIDRAGETSGYMPGTLITRAAGTDRGVQNKYQLFIGWNATVAQTFICSRCTHVSSVGALIWSKWEKLSNSYCLSATNEVIREERITSGEAPFSDLNDAPINSIYQIDLDCVSMANDPLAGHSQVIITYGFDCVSRHGMVQQLFGLDNGVNMFVRYGYVNAPNDYRWTAWKKVVTEDVE